MTEGGRFRTVEILILAGVAIAFVDESVRKALPGAPILVTGVKDLLFLLAGFLLLFHERTVPRRYATYFLPWVLVTFASAVWVFTRFHSVVLLGATLRTYCFVPLLFAVGYHLGSDEASRRRVIRIFLVGGIAAIAVAFAQEYGREALPLFLSARVYRAKHGGAGGEYNESLFTSPQTLSQLAVVLATWSFAALILPGLSRHRLLALGLFLASLATIYLSRIRIAVIVLAFVVSLMWLGVWKVATPRGRMPAPLRGIIVGLAVAFFAGGFYLLVYPELTDAAGEEVARDIHYYEKLLDLDLIQYRSGLFLREYTISAEHDWFFGHGSGTGGRMRGFVDTEFFDIPVVSDTGLYLLFHEMGMLGLVSFLFCYGGLVIHCALRMAMRPAVPPVALPAFAIGAAFLFWFLLKSHACIANGFSHILWIGSVGLCCAALDSDRREPPFDAAPEVPVPSPEENDEGHTGRP